MRLIKFRFWKGNILQGILELKVGSILDMAWEWDAADEFTGLTDKNGKEIYEGDIVSYLGYEVQNGKQIRPRRIKEISDFIYDCYYLANIISSNDTVEVVGNRYENPELLGKI